MASRLTLFKYLPRTLRPTKEGWYFVFFTLGIGVAAVNTGNNLLYLLVALMLSIIVVSGLLSEQSLRRLSLSVDLPASAVAGAPVSIVIRLQNQKKRLPSFSLRIAPAAAAEVPDGAFTSEEARFICLGPGSTESQPLRMIFAKRGRYRLEGLTLSTTFPFGFFVKTAVRREPMELWVYPRIRPVVRPRLPPSAGAALSSDRSGQGAAFHQVRAYQRGDDARLIHWKLSARQGRWIIKEREREEGSGVLLVLDNVAPSGEEEGWEGRFERAVETAASLAAEMILAGWTVSIRTADQAIDPGEGPAQRDRILRFLTLIAPLRESPVSRRAVAPEGRGIVTVRWHRERGGIEIAGEAGGVDAEGGAP